MRAFADALDCVPMALAENSGLSPIETLANIKSRQAKEKNTRLGVDCMQTGSNGMSLLFLFSVSEFVLPSRFRVARFISEHDMSTSPFICRFLFGNDMPPCIGCTVPWYMVAPDFYAGAGCPSSTTPTHYLRRAFVKPFTTLYFFLKSRNAFIASELRAAVNARAAFQRG